MLAELAAANAAFAIVKKTVLNGRELADCAKSISDFVQAKDILQNKGTKRTKSVFAKMAGKDAGDFEEFMALEKIRQQEEQLKQLMIYTGRPGLWQDWIRFQGRARVARQEEQARRVREREELVQAMFVTLLSLGVVAGVTVISYIIYRGSAG